MCLPKSQTRSTRRTPTSILRRRQRWRCSAFTTQYLTPTTMVRVRWQLHRRTICTLSMVQISIIAAVTLATISLLPTTSGSAISGYIIIRVSTVPIWLSMVYRKCLAMPKTISINSLMPRLVSCVPSRLSTLLSIGAMCLSRQLILQPIRRHSDLV